MLKVRIMFVMFIATQKILTVDQANAKVLAAPIVQEYADQSDSQEKSAIQVLMILVLGSAQVSE